MECIVAEDVCYADHQNAANNIVAIIIVVAIIVVGNSIKDYRDEAYG